jgi:hypothetical protein
LKKQFRPQYQNRKEYEARKETKVLSILHKDLEKKKQEYGDVFLRAVTTIEW